MHSTPVFIILMATFFANHVSAATPESETVGHFLLSLPASSIGPVIDHCSEAYPEIKDALREERAGFIDKLTQAANALAEKLKNDPDFNAPIQDIMRDEVAKAHAHALTTLKQQDPGVTCRNILENMQNATADDLRKLTEDTYYKFRSFGLRQLGRSRKADRAGIME